MRDWVKQAEADAGERDGLAGSEREEPAALRRENRRLREDVDILKRDSFLREGDPVTVHPFIEAEKSAGHGVKRACELLKVSRTAYYAHRAARTGPRAVGDAELAQQIADVHTRSRATYGAPRVHAVLKRAGAGCGRRRVARLMRAAGLQGRHRRRRHLTTIPDPRAALRPDLVADALTAACQRRRPARPVISHPDRGCQHTSHQFTALADQLVLRLSVGRTGQCWDNALAESFFATIKRELLDTTSWPSRATARTAILDFIEGWYNLHRLHSSLGYRSPAEYETALAA